MGRRLRKCPAPLGRGARSAEGLPMTLFLASASALRPRALALVAALTLPLMLACSQAQETTDQVVARVDGVDIKASDLAIAEEDIGANLQQVPPPQRRDYLVTYLADMI